MRTEAITLLKEDVLAMGQMVTRTVEEMTKLLKNEPSASLNFVEEQELTINQSCQDIEEKCMDLLLDKDLISAKDIRALVGSTIIGAKLERMADHANRVARIASWAIEEEIEIPSELAEMGTLIQRMVQDVLLSFLTADTGKAQEVLQRDSHVNYLHDLLSKQLLSDLGEQDQVGAFMRAQFLFCARFLERMGDACTSIAKRVYFIETGTRLKPETKKEA